MPPSTCASSGVDTMDIAHGQTTDPSSFGVVKKGFRMIIYQLDADLATC